MTRGASTENPDDPKRIDADAPADVGDPSADKGRPSRGGPRIGGQAAKGSPPVVGNPPARVETAARPISPDRDDTPTPDDSPTSDATPAPADSPTAADSPASGDSPTAGDREPARPSLLVPAPFDPRRSPLVSTPAALFDAVAAERLDPDWLRRRFAHPPAWTPEQSSDRIVLRPGPPRPAAVLVPIVAHGGAPTVLLTKRTMHLRNHSGQIAFPGGRFEPDDDSPVRTALREAQEEVGLDPGRVEVIGRLPDYLTGTGYRVTPVVGLIPPGQPLQPDPHEVAAIFEVPLGFLMDPRHHEQRLIEVQGASRMFWAMPYRALDSDDEYFIWGATAAMLRNLYRLLAA